MSKSIIKNNIINRLSRHLFWDIDTNNIDEQKNKKYVITKVLQYGLYNDWEELIKFYGLNTVVEISKTIKDLDNKTLSFLSTIGEVPLNEFLCYTTKQSIPKHWNF